MQFRYIGTFGDMGTGKLLAKTREIAFFGDISKFGDIGLAIYGPYLVYNMAHISYEAFSCNGFIL